jgi:transposase InsO family protein
VLRSTERAGVCWDNAAAVSFSSTLKTEFYNRRTWPTKAEARLAVGAWIEDRYNRRRRHSAIGMISPVRFEQLHTQVAEAA